jgi:serine/threonine-protein kinase
MPIWTPDGKRVTFASSRASSDGLAPDLAWKLADGTGKQEQLCSMDNAQFPTCWSPDGRTLLFTDEHPDTKFDMWMLFMEGGREQQSLLVTEFNETAGVFSPDGRWIAYQSDESGRYEIYVVPFRGSGPKHHISVDGGTQPVWAPDGRELFYRRGDRMMVVSVQSSPEFTAKQPELLFEGRYMTARIGAGYDITPDGRRFMMIMGSETESGTLTELKLILNWSEEIKRRVSSGK